jgi:hypothetical protein
MERKVGGIARWRIRASMVRGRVAKLESGAVGVHARGCESRDDQL